MQDDEPAATAVELEDDSGVGCAVEYLAGAFGYAQRICPILRTGKGIHQAIATPVLVELEQGAIPVRPSVGGYAVEEPVATFHQRCLGSAPVAAGPRKVAQDCVAAAVSAELEYRAVIAAAARISCAIQGAIAGVDQASGGVLPIGGVTAKAPQNCVAAPIPIDLEDRPQVAAASGLGRPV